MAPTLWYLARRLAQAALVLWSAFTVTFVILYALPSDPVEIALNGGQETGTASEQELERIRAEYGLDQPLPLQYLRMLGQFLTGDLGRSIATGRPVAEALQDALPSTLLLGGLALGLAVLLGGGIAIAATYTRWRPVQRLLLALPPLGAAVPTFWSGLLLLQVFSFGLGWFPSIGNAGAASLVLPTIALALPSAAYLAQVLSRSLRATLAKPYIETARARGASELHAFRKDALRNALIPTLTMLGICAGQLLSGAVVVETVFSRAGIGRLTQRAVATQDIPVVQALVLVAALIFVVANLVVDLLYPVIDPRVSTAAGTSGRAR